MKSLAKEIEALFAGRTFVTDERDGLINIFTQGNSFTPEDAHLDLSDDIMEEWIFVTLMEILEEVADTKDVAFTLRHALQAM